MTITNTMPTIVLSIALLTFAVLVLWMGVITPRTREGNKLTLPLSRREKRRLIVSFILLIVALLIFASATFISFEGRPVFWAFYMLTILILLIGIIILALADSLETVRTTLLTLTTTRRNVNEQMRQLDDELHKLTMSNSSRNGKGKHSPTLD